MKTLRIITHSFNVFKLLKVLLVDDPGCLRSTIGNEWRTCTTLDFERVDLQYTVFLLILFHIK